MTIRTVSVGQSIQAAIDAAQPGDTIDVQGGTYGSQFLTITKNLTVEAIGSAVILHATNAPPNGKAMIDAGGTGVTVNLSGFDVSGVAVSDQNGAAIRYEGGSLRLSNVNFHNNQEGLLGAADAAGSISIDHSEIANNGDGSGSTHNLYIGAIASFGLTNSYVHDAVVGHEVKSRAATNTITGNRIFDNNGSASYSIDLPNGGNASVSGNAIEQGAHTQNPYILAYGEEGQTNAGTSFAISSNTVVNDDPAGAFLLDPTATKPALSGNSEWGLASPSGMTVLASRPSLDTSAMQFIYPGAAPPPPVANPPPPPPAVPPSPPPPPPLTLSQYHTLILADFNVYSKAHPEVWQSPVSVHALMTEIGSTTVLAHVAGDLWSGL